ncbi:hypothetical protein JCM11641_004210 [Rhodosporidiobolus odoratus]
MAQPQPPAKQQPVPRRITKKGLFAKDLAPMMYGFGDDNPAPDTIAVMEELVIEHITDICAQAHLISTNRGKIKVDDFRFALRRDPKKLARLDELLFMQEEITRARRGFEDPLAGMEGEEAEGVGGGTAPAKVALGASAPGGEGAAGGGGGQKPKKDKGKGKA